MARIAKILIFCIAVSLCSTGCTKSINVDLNNKTIEYTGIVLQDKEFGAVYIEADSEEFHQAGFELGDSCNIDFHNGYTLEDVPFYNGYYVRSGFPLIVDYKGYPHIAIAFCSGDLMWEKVGCKEGDSVTITLNERGKYLTTQNSMNLVFSTNRSDFDSDEMFANFRVLSGGNIKDGLIYRGASPVNNTYNRANITDSLIEKNGIRFILDLSDNSERIESYMGKDDFQSDYFQKLYYEGNVVPVGLNVAFKSEVYGHKLVEALNLMSATEGPYYIQCTEGKDRTGFVCILLEAIAGYSYDEIKDDYMYSFYNFYGITEVTNPTGYKAIADILFFDMLFFLTATDNEDAAKKVITEQTAKSYLLNNGMSESEYERLVNCITYLEH